MLDGTIEKEYVFSKTEAFAHFCSMLQNSEIKYTVLDDVLTVYVDSSELVYGKYTIQQCYEYVKETHSTFNKFKKKVRKVLSNFDFIFSKKLWALVTVFLISIAVLKFSQLSMISKAKVLTGNLGELTKVERKDDTKFVERVFNNISVNIIQPTPTPTPEPKGLLERIFKNE